jgi:hypothetical protein
VTAKERRFVEDVSIMFAQFCDMNGLSVDRGTELAERVGEEIEQAAEDRRWQEGVPGSEAA